MFKRTLPITALLLLSLLLAACGSAGSTGSGSSGSAVIKTTTATINGASKTILTNTQGMTLYYFTPDSATTAACTTGCVSTWPPLLLQGSTPAGVTSLSGTLNAVSDGNGMQVEYNGHPLYTYSGDTAAGQTNGEGIGGKWFVATSDLSSQGAPQATPTTSGSKNGGY